MVTTSNLAMSKASSENGYATEPIPIQLLMLQAASQILGLDEEAKAQGCGLRRHPDAPLRTLRYWKMAHGCVGACVACLWSERVEDVAGGWWRVAHSEKR